jgi:hypothetical protein
MSRAALSYARLLEGVCWRCLGPLERILDWGECFGCGRRFTVRGKTVVEQIAVVDEYRGKDVWLGGELLCTDGTVVEPMDNGMVRVPWSAEWIVCTWVLA